MPKKHILYSDKASLWGSTIHVTKSSVCHTLPVVKGSQRERDLLAYLEMQKKLYRSQELTMEIETQQKGNIYSVGFKLEPKEDPETDTVYNSVLPYLFCSLEEFCRKNDHIKQSSAFYKQLPDYGHMSLIWVGLDPESNQLKIVNFDFGFASWIFKNTQPTNVELHEEYSSITQQHLWYQHDASYVFAKNEDKNISLLARFTILYDEKFQADQAEERRELKRQEELLNQRKSRQQERVQLGPLIKRSVTPTKRSKLDLSVSTLPSRDSTITTNKNQMYNATQYGNVKQDDIQMEEILPYDSQFPISEIPEQGYSENDMALNVVSAQLQEQLNKLTIKQVPAEDQVVLPVKENSNLLNDPNTQLAQDGNSYKVKTEIDALNNAP